MIGRDGRPLFWLQGHCSGEGGRITAVMMTIIRFGSVGYAQI